MKNKKFVLLLDDIWRKVDLAEIGIPFPTRENGCKVVFTTRSREVCGHMGVDDPMEVQCLTDNEAWDLFEQKVGPLTLKSHPGIPEKSKESCWKMSWPTNSSQRHWRDHVKQEDYTRMASCGSGFEFICCRFSGMEDQILPVLKYSYDDLKGDQIKSCFEYCSLFPEDHLIEKERLIDYWICEGFISENEDRERTVNQGHEIIGTLVRSCLLLEEGSNVSKVKMHDVVREMALWILSDLGKNREKCIVRAGVELSEVPKIKKWSAVERMSLMTNKIEKIFGSPKCPKLTTLFLQGMYLTRISGGFFTCMPKLVVLDLSENSRLTRLPEEISELVSLKYLDLSRTWIWQLPVCVQKLKKLIHLYLEDMQNLRRIDGISKLSSLRTLKLLGCDKLRFDKSWKELLLLEHLEVLTIEIKSNLVLEKLFFSHMGKKCIQRVVIKDTLDKSIGFSNIPTILRTLRGPCFPSLSSVALEMCSGLNDLTWLLCAPNLIHIHLSYLEHLEVVVSKEKADEMEVQGIIPFGKLETLVMVNLPEVKSIYWTPLPFPCLREMTINRCPKLAKLPLDSKSVAEVERFVIKCEAADWIERVEWEDEDTRLRFLPSRRMEDNPGRHVGFR